MTTTYGTIPTNTAANLEYMSRDKNHIKEGSLLPKTRPWKLMFECNSFRLPRNINNLKEATKRFKTNIAFFQTNYIIILLMFMFLSLLWNPISLIVFVVMMFLWLVFYFLRREPVLVFGRVLVDDRVVLIVLFVLTFAFLSLTHVALNVLVSVCVGCVFVVVHGGLRKTDDLYLDAEESSLLG